MKILGSLFAVFGTGSFLLSCFYYWLWWDLSHVQNLGQTQSTNGAAESFVKDHSHGFFLVALILSAAMIAVAIRLLLYRKRRKT